MACYHPMIAYRSRAGRDPKTGKWPVVFNISKGYADMEVTVACGQCIGCRLERSRQWAIRCVHEASLHPINCFITLTYSPEYEGRLKIPLPDPDTGEIIGSQLSLRKDDFVLFMKRLRKKFGEGIRFFHCGEYGEENFRPHHHAILFNHDFADKKFWKSNNGFVLYRSAALEKLWPYGYSSVGSVSFESAAYVARYITKKITGDMADSHYLGLVPEYVTMSRRPGIAREWFEKFKDTDVYSHDTVVLRNLKLRPPKYYDKLYDLENPEGFSRIKAKRVFKAISSADNSPERLLVRGTIQKSKADRLIRKFY